MTPFRYQICFPFSKNLFDQISVHRRCRTRYRKLLGDITLTYISFSEIVPIIYLFFWLWPFQRGRKVNNARYVYDTAEERFVPLTFVFLTPKRCIMSVIGQRQLLDATFYIIRLCILRRYYPL